MRFVISVFMLLTTSVLAPESIAISLASTFGLRGLGNQKAGIPIIDFTLSFGQPCLRV